MTVMWEFTVESLTSVNNIGIFIHPPVVVGTLSISDQIWASGVLDYGYENVDRELAPNNHIVQNGQIGGWNLDLGIDLIFPSPRYYDYYGHTSLTFNKVGDLSGNIFQFGYSSDLSMSIGNNLASGIAASDGSVFGCGWMGVCDYTGTWSLVSQLPNLSASPITNDVSEPSMVLTLVVALVIATCYRQLKLGS